MLRAPTGLGKTDADPAFLAPPAGCWNRRRTPRRLVWVPSRQGLTEQVASVAEERVRRLADAGLMQSICGLSPHGRESEDTDASWGPTRRPCWWATGYSAEPRAESRRCAASRSVGWIDFALLNNDCLWIMDTEVPVAGRVGLIPSLSLLHFARKFRVFGSTPSCWISATVDPHGWRRWTSRVVRLARSLWM